MKNRIRIFKLYKIIFWVAAPCTEVDLDRWSPDYGGCCPGLTTKVEPRPTASNYYCPSSDANHGSSCWSTIVMCRIQGMKSLPKKSTTFVCKNTMNGRQYISSIDFYF